MRKCQNFKFESKQRIYAQGQDISLKTAADAFLRESFLHQYSYNFECLGRPIIQYPQDMIAIQEIIWATKPDLIIETGIAHGGSLVMSAAMLALIDISEVFARGEKLDPSSLQRKVLGVDVDIREHNRVEIENHPLSAYIEMIEGSSISNEVIQQVKNVASSYQKIMVFLDSNHTHEHVLAELNAFAPLVSKDSYCVVFDTIVDTLPSDFFLDRPWGMENNPRTAVDEYLKSHPEFKVDLEIDKKLLISVSPSGWLYRLR